MSSDIENSNFYNYLYDNRDLIKKLIFAYGQGKAVEIITNRLYQKQKEKNQKKISSSKSKMSKNKKVSTKKNFKKPKNSSKTKWKFKRRKVSKIKQLNVKADTEGYFKTYKKQKVSKKIQNKINRFFKLQYTPFSKVWELAYTDTVPGSTDNCKYMWFTGSTMSEISEAWSKFTVPTTITHKLNDSWNTTTNTAYQAIGGEQLLYWAQSSMNYQIYNPANYDMTVVIYDIICKQDTQGTVSSLSINNITQNDDYVRLSQVGDFNPVNCMYQSTIPHSAYYPTTNIDTPTGYPAQISDATQLETFNIQMSPTNSYKFNLYWKIIKKRVIKLQPGATFTHVFTYKPKFLMERAKWYYNYPDQFRNNQTDYQKLLTSGLKNITCGSLFKYYGQISGSTYTKNDDHEMDDKNKVVNLSGRLMIKCSFENRWYYGVGNVKFQMKGNIGYNNPGDEEKFLVVNDVSIKEAEDEPAGYENVDID